MTSARRARAIPCASILKPVFVALAEPGRPLSSRARRSIRTSDNQATDDIVASLGGPRTLPELLGQVTPGLEFDPRREPTWGRLLITAEQITDLYVEMVLPHRWVLEAMRQVREPQRFGAPEHLAVKAGWDYWPAARSLVTHVATVGETVHVASSATPISQDEAATWHALLSQGGPSAVIPLHQAALAVD